MASVNNRKPVDIQHQHLESEHSKPQKYLKKMIRWTGRSVKSISEAVFKLFGREINKPLDFLKRKNGRSYTLGAGGYARVELARQDQKLKAVKILYDNP